MPELRKDPIIDRWVIISTGREGRPTDFVNRTDQIGNSLSPFAPGNEAMTPPEILSLPEERPAGSPWTLRVVPNKYPALLNKGEVISNTAGLYRAMSGIGAHEVIIETPDDDRSLADLAEADIANVFRTYARRIKALKDDARLEYALVYKNHGSAAGATLRHAHSQLLALPMVPASIRDELKGAQDYYQRQGRCVFCDILRHEKEDKRRIVIENEHFCALQPYAARFPFETWILPRAHASHFENLAADKFAALAAIMQSILRKIDQALDKPALNYLIHTAPLKQVAQEHFHWHIELFPKLTQIAGFEVGSGYYINPTSPEDAAARLRQALV